MSLAEHLGTVQRVPAPGDCGVCQWYAALDEDDRMTFDAVVASGGNKSQLWLKCSTWPGNELPVKRARFSECLNYHDRGSARVAS
jgi:hypothetical protein